MLVNNEYNDYDDDYDDSDSDSDIIRIIMTGHITFAAPSKCRYCCAPRYIRLDYRFYVRLHRLRYDMERYDPI